MPVDEAVRGYIETIDPGHRPLFGRLHGLVLTACPGAAVSISYGMPAYKAGRRRIYLAGWKHGVSVYGCQGRDGGFISRHPALKTSKGTIQLRPGDAAGIPDDEFLALFRSALEV